MPFPVAVSLTPNTSYRSSLRQLRGSRQTCFFGLSAYSTVTDLAKLRG